GDLIHTIVQKKFIWKFEPLLEEGMLLCLNNLTFVPQKKKCSTPPRMTTARTLTGISILLLLKPPVRRFLATSSSSLSLRTLQLLPPILTLLM
ncbi:hypothetical protein MKW92_016546, partial [Papaver armeniacum]